MFLLCLCYPTDFQLNQTAALLADPARSERKALAAALAGVPPNFAECWDQGEGFDQYCRVRKSLLLEGHRME
jgi:hypothetical protein